MTINSLSAIASTPVCGLGTQTFNVVTAGEYTCSFKSFLPYLAAGGLPVTTQPQNNVQIITTVADSSGSLNSTYFTFYTTGNLYGYYVWYNINSAGVDPAPAGLTGIEVSAATNATANTIASDTRTAITAAVSYVTVTGTTDVVIITQTYYGGLTAAADSSGAATGFTFGTSSPAGSYGTPAVSGLDVVINHNGTAVARYGWPTPTQPVMGGSVVILCSVSDTITVVFSSLSTADAGLNAVKSIVNVYQGIGN